jgi:hypothetical protein
MVVRIFGPKREWRIPRCGELNELYFLLNIVRVIKPKGNETAGHVARTGREEVYAVFWWGNLRKRDRLVDKGVGGRIILKWNFKQ